MPYFTLRYSQAMKHRVVLKGKVTLDYASSYCTRWSKWCKGFRIMHPRVAATACVFFRRFYLRNDFCTVDPRAVAPAALYLAAKVEETLLQARLLFHTMQKLAGGLPPPATAI